MRGKVWLLRVSLEPCDGILWSHGAPTTSTPRSSRAPLTDHRVGKVELVVQLGSVTAATGEHQQPCATGREGPFHIQAHPLGGGSGELATGVAVRPELVGRVAHATRLQCDRSC